MGGTGKLVCPWMSGQANATQSAPSNKFGGATRHTKQPFPNVYDCGR